MRKGLLSAASLLLSGVPALAQPAPESYLPKAFFPTATIGEMPGRAPLPQGHRGGMVPGRVVDVQHRVAVPAAPMPPAFAAPARPHLMAPYMAPQQMAPQMAPYMAPQTVPAPLPAFPAAAHNPRSFLPQTYFPAVNGPHAPHAFPASSNGEVIVSVPETGGPVGGPVGGGQIISGPLIGGPVAVMPGPVMMAPPPAPHGSAGGPPIAFRRGPGPAAFFDVIPGIAYAPTAGPEPFHRPTNESCWVSASYLLGWIRSGPLDTPLVTTSTSTDPNVDRGALGAPGTRVLFGNDDLSFGAFSGLRIHGGLWLDDQNHYSIDAGFFWLAPRHTGISLASDGSTTLGRPVFNVADGANVENVYLIADRDPVSGTPLNGSIDIDARSQLYGGELNGGWHAYFNKRVHGQALLGFRSVHLGERLSITDRISSTQDDFITFKGNPVSGGDIVTEQDIFRTSNTFYGFQVGGRIRWEYDWFFIDSFAKVGVGATYQNINIDGAGTLSSGGVVVDRARGGILALPSNIGEYDRTRFGVIPEVGVNLGFDLTGNLRFTAGYSFLAWNQVARPGNQIDRSVNVGQVPGDQEFGNTTGPARPRPVLSDNFFWLQTLNFGLELHY